MALHAKPEDQERVERAFFRYFVERPQDFSEDQRNQVIEKLLTEVGYENPKFRYLGAGRVAWILPLLYTYAIVVAKLDDIEIGYSDRWCFSDRKKAESALEVWDPEKDKEPMGWHRHPTSGRRREGGDPTRETISL